MIKQLVIASVLLVPAVALAQNQPMYAPPPTHTGLTFEANLGFGLLRIANDNGDSESEGALGGLNLGIGGFLNPQMAVTVRASGVTYVEDGGSLTQAFFGPSLQYWVTPNAWIGGGVGLGVARIVVDGFGSDSETGFALDARAGYTFNPGSKHSFNISAEITPAFIEEATFTGIAILFGYQTL